MSDKITNLIDFVAFTHEIREVKRALWVRGEEQFENDSEHSYQLAMTALYIVQEQKLSIDPYKAMALALVHDVIEVYAGDTPAFGSAELVNTQSAREQAAKVQLKKRWPRMVLMHELIEEHEARESAESRFVYALDKLITVLNNYVDNGRSWRREGIKFADIAPVKAKKVAFDPVIKAYYDDLMKLLAEKPELFG